MVNFDRASQFTAQEFAQVVNDQGYYLGMRRILCQLFCSEVFVSPVAKEEW